MGENKKFCILLVDDSEVNQEIWPALLEHEGYKVFAARDGEEALAIAEKEPIDLVLLDVMMPGMSGFEVLHALRRDQSSDSLPVIMATSVDESEDVVRAFKLGANDYVTKPLDPAVTLVRIQAQLRHREPHALGNDLDTAIDRIKPGSVLEGKYRLESLIGRGNFGAVYRATHLKLQRPVAVKVLRAAVNTDAVSIARFQQEGISLSKLEHPNAVRVLDFSVSPGSLTYLVMELLDGVSLEQELTAAVRLSPERCAEVLFPVCDVLKEAHSLGIIHRDIKPQNIFLHQGRRGEMVKVLDFGIAKLVSTEELRQQLTVEGNSVGTPAYMAPERFTNEPYDGRADVYSLAVMLYEMLSGETPFAHADGNFFKLIRMHVVEEPKPLPALVPGIPPAVDALVQRGLSKRSMDRPTVEEFAQELAAALGVELPDSSGDVTGNWQLDSLAKRGEDAEEPTPLLAPTIEWKNE